MQGCGSNDTSSDSSDGDNIIVTQSEDEQDQDPLVTLNAIRTNSGLNTLSSNSELSISAQKHADYLKLNNTSGHYQVEGNSGFTGVNPVDRTMSAEYLSRVISENASAGQSSYNASIEGLMSAIYHRFGFLAYNIDEIGIGKNSDKFVYNMGNSQLNTLCEGTSFSNTGTYYTSVCKDSDFKIEATQYDNAKIISANSDKAYIIYPYDNATDVYPVFFEEHPDPLPNSNVCGYPISIEFNANGSTNIDTITNVNFTLVDSNSNTVTSLITMNKDNDPNKKFSKYQFALFPQDRLEFGSKYSATFSYTDSDSKSQSISWSFTTQSLSNVLTVNGSNDSFSVDSGTTYYLYFKPQSTTDIFTSIASSYTSGLTQNVDIVDGNLLKITLTGNSNMIFNLETSSSRKITLTLN